MFCHLIYNLLLFSAYLRLLLLPSLELLGDYIELVFSAEWLASDLTVWLWWEFLSQWCKFYAYYAIT